MIINNLTIRNNYANLINNSAVIFNGTSDIKSLATNLTNLVYINDSTVTMTANYTGLLYKTVLETKLGINTSAVDLYGNIYSNTTGIFSSGTIYSNWTGIFSSGTITATNTGIYSAGTITATAVNGIGIRSYGNITTTSANSIGIYSHGSITATSAGSVGI